MDLDGILFAVSVWTIPVLVAVTLHEAAHGWVAWKLGDDTAYRAGRVTFNPFRHIHPFGTVLLPAMLLLASGGRMMFGFARPVPVAFHRLGRPRRDMVLVALAGPAANLLIATAAAALFHILPVLWPDFRQWVAYNLSNAIWLNMVLAVFNMLPIPPLDGGRVAVGLLPRSMGRALARMEKAGIVVILLAVFLVPWLGGRLGLDINVFQWLVGRPAAYMTEALAGAMGIL